MSISAISRFENRQPGQLRPITIETGFTAYAEGSVLIKAGNTHVLCNASVLDRVPPFLDETQQGWITAEYGMLPRATNTRGAREAVRGRQSGRTQEIQRLIGRSLRAVFNLEALAGYTIQLDCDVIQADGGTRCAAITGAWVAAALACQYMQSKGLIEQNPINDQVAAVAVGLIDGQALLDLDYEEDSRGDADINIVMTGSKQIVEIQGTAEGHTFTREQLNNLIDLAANGITELLEIQRQSLNAS